MTINWFLHYQQRSSLHNASFKIEESQRSLFEEHCAGEALQKVTNVKFLPNAVLNLVMKKRNTAALIFSFFWLLLVWFVAQL